MLIVIETANDTIGSKYINDNVNLVKQIIVVILLRLGAGAYENVKFGVRQIISNCLKNTLLFSF